ncbi:MAG: hypothetical protein IPN50_01230 [Sphingomonadales bacterium]|jgi:tetratricopeptide (TPR) repeat protein|uniref:tetratricopeptide repeat protein n=2 Tax=Sphingorhabdus sp. TaxID=1902408 RepID=UPI003BAF731D|nr:hypothetical protein [Sphingomonadales bacterium]MBK9431076.1 hypothetical protein [Sphingomonadales bacterium]
MSKLLSRFGWLPLFVMAVSPAFAETAVDQDVADVAAAFKALEAHDFDHVLEKSGAVIGRFEARKEADTVYVCTSGGPDTIFAMTSAALEAQSADGKVAKTIAIADAICDSYFVKGFALIDLKRPAEALPNLEAAVALDPDNQHYINELAEWYKLSRNWNKSLELFTLASETSDFAIISMEDRKVSERITNQMRCRSFRGIAFNQVELQNWEEARTALQKCLTLNPDDAASKAELGYIQQQTGK